MKKNWIYSKWCFALACALLMGVATSCGDDDGEGSGTGTGQQPTLPDLGITDPVVAVAGEYDGERFNYENDVLVGGTGFYDADYTFYIGNAPLVLKVFQEDYEETWSNIRTNEHGAITYASLLGVSLGEDFTGTFTAKYNEDNQMTESALELSEDDVTEHDKWTFVWENGNMVSYRNTYSIDYTDEEDFSYSDNGWFDYGDSPVSNNGIYHPDMFPYDYYFMLYAGLFGKPTKDMPVSVVFSSTDGYGDDAYAYTAEKDEKGRIVTLYCDGEAYYYYGYADRPIELTGAGWHAPGRAVRGIRARLASRQAR